MTPTANLLEGRLEPEETVLWAGQPHKPTYVMGGTWLMMPLALLWAGLTMIVEIQLLVQGAPLWIDVLGLVFVVSGLYLTVVRFWLAAREADRTFYLVTDRRILIQSGAFRPRVVELSLAALPYVQLAEQPAGTGSIYFRPPGVQRWLVGGGWPPWGARRVPAFSCIERAARVYHIIERTLYEQVGP